MKMTAQRVILGASVALAAIAGQHRSPARRTIRPRAITVIIPFAGGSASDVVSRIMFDKMSQDRWASRSIVENRPGAGGNTGTRCGEPRPRPTATPWSAAAPARSPPTWSLYKDARLRSR